MIRIALRSLAAHRGRLLMTVLSVLLGVAFVSGAAVFGDTLTAAYTRGAGAATADVVVSADPGRPSLRAVPDLPQDLLPRLAALPGTAAARPEVGGPVAVATRSGGLLGGAGLRGGAYVAGEGGTDSHHPLVAGRAPAAAGEVALSRTAAALGDYRSGDTVRLSVDGTVHPYTLVGEFGPAAGATDAAPAAPAGPSDSAAPAVLFDEATAQRLFLAPGRISGIELTVAAGTTPDQLLTRVRAALPADAGAVAETGSTIAAQRAAEAARDSETLRYALLGFAWTALLVAGFSIVNTFQMLVAQRTREIALLRAVGASRRQVVRSVRAEALVIGTVSAAAGCALGVLVAPALHAVLAAAGTRLPWGPLVISPSTLLVALLTGVAVTLLGAWLPARRAARTAPVEALREAAAAPGGRGRRVARAAVGVLCAAVAAYAVRAGVAAGGGVGMKDIAVALPLVLAALVLLAPALARPVIGPLGPVLRRIGGAVGTLAGRNAVRNPQRTGATAAAVAIGVMLVTALPVLAASLQHNLVHQTTDGLRADYQVSMAIPARLDPGVATTLARTPGVTAVSALQSGVLRVGGQERGVTGVDPAGLTRVLDVRPVEGAVGALAKSGTVAVSEDLAGQQGWSTGTRIPVGYADGQQETLTVGTVFRANRFLSDLLLPTATLARHTAGRLQDATVLVDTADGAGPAAARRLTAALGGNPGIAVRDKAQLTEVSGGQLGVLVKVLYGLLAMTVVMAVLSVANTLVLSVSERTREIGLLRALGQSAAGVRAMVRTEAVLIALFGVVLGATCGLALAAAVCAASGLPFALPPSLVAVPAAAVLVSLAAAGWPARRAARTAPLRAIGEGP
ncbi:ABC transporter permease [Streptomyces sp. NPDC059918]|uniref:ABC transporter permease n=1 Tax=unclassified Streptomyces TaxID=2593676 RepID=UPI003669D773